MSTTYVTIVAKNYLAYARTLMQSLASCHPHSRRVVILVDSIDSFFDPGEECFEIILSSDLQIPQSAWFHFKYTVLELSTAVKPWVLEWFLDRGAERVIYFDPDIYVYNSPEVVLSSLSGKTALLTPHLTAPLTDSFHPSELDILNSGTYNLGFIAINNCSEARKLLRWWQSHLYNDCVVNLNRGIFVDQRWMDLATGLFRGIEITRNPGCNLAYWNLAQRSVTQSNDDFFVDGMPLIFFHFSGFDANNPNPLSKHQNRLSLDDIGPGAVLAHRYAAQLLENGYSECQTLPYRYGFFENGSRILDGLRFQFWTERGVNRQVSDPFSLVGRQEFVKYWNTPAFDVSGAITPLPKIAYRVLQLRPDVQAVFPDGLNRDLEGLLGWMITSGQAEFCLDDELMKEVRCQHEKCVRNRLEQMPANPSPAEGRMPELPIPAAPARLPFDINAERFHWRTKDGKVEWSPPRDLWQNICQGTTGLELPRLARGLYLTRPDLRKTFPDPGGRDSLAFLQWFIHSAPKEYEFDPLILADARNKWRLANQNLGLPLRQAFNGATNAARVLKLALGLGNDEKRVRIRLAAASDFVPRTPLAQQHLKAKPAYPEESAGKFGLNLVGYLHSEMGVGESVRVAAKAARTALLPVSLRKVSVNDVHRKQDLRVKQSEDEWPYFVNVFHVNADQAAPAYQQLGDQFYRDRVNIAYWAWELEEFPDCWRQSFGYYDEIWCPSGFCQRAISHCSPVPVVVMPHSIEVELDPTITKVHLGLPSETFLVLTLFDMLSVFDRKNPTAAIQAFRVGLGNDPNAHLILKISNGEYGKSEMSLLREAVAGLRVTVIDRTLTRSEVYALIHHCDCLLSLHRSEGFGLSIAEAMYLGKPVVATAYSGNMDFMTPGNSFHVDYNLRAVGPNAAPYDPNSRWAEPSVNSAANHLKKIRCDPNGAIEVALKGQATIKMDFSAESVGKKMKQRLHHHFSRQPS